MIDYNIITTQADYNAMNLLILSGASTTDFIPYEVEDDRVEAFVHEH